MSSPKVKGLVEEEDDEGMNDLADVTTKQARVAAQTSRIFLDRTGNVPENTQEAITLKQKKITAFFEN
ncbi:hypothetical protein HHI36_006524 [Cryptolaemus montrouzieri]|uniref:Uncharacterized protein n=1 Tax=Cryptolaemus montrouzieri TaxID=559131 RepID=A0ABD2NYE0_9CUCU